MYPSFIVADALDRLIHDRFPFDGPDERTLADLGIDRKGRFVAPGDSRSVEPSPITRPEAGLSKWFSSLLTSLAPRRPAL